MIVRAHRSPLLTARFLYGVAFIAFIGGTASCSGSAEDQPQDLQAKKEALDTKEEDLSALKEEVNALRKEIQKMDTYGSQKKILPVQVKKLKPRKFEHFVDFTGTIASQGNVLPSAETTGRVMEIPATEGERVQAGTVLVKLDNEVLKNQLDEARASYDLAKTTYQRRARLWKDSIGSEIEYLNAKTNFQAAKNRLGQIRSRYENSFIKAPVDGKVDDIVVNVGEFVAVGQAIVRVIDLDNLYAEAELSEKYMDVVESGDSVELRVPSANLQQWERVNFVSQYINPANRSFKIRVDVENAQGVLKPNALTQLRLRDYRSDSALVVPADAILKDLEGTYIYVLTRGKEGGYIARKRRVTRGRSYANKSEITQGLQAQDKVIVTGYNQVSDGDPVRVQ